MMDYTETIELNKKLKNKTTKMESLNKIFK